MLDLNKLYLYRMTHIENVPHILQFCLTQVFSDKANLDYKAIGDNSLINNRTNFLTPNGKMLGQFIPFYFGPRMPMLYVIQKGYNGVSVTAPEDIVYCIITVQQVINHKLPFLFTNGHAVNGLSNFYDENDLTKIETIIDWKAINTIFWIDENDLDLKRRKEAEFLIESEIPATCIVGWVVFNEQAKS